MKLEEEFVERYLKAQGYKSIVFEPLGKSKPPDFEIFDNIGIEVRRLNKHISINGKSQPVEDLKFVLIPKFEKILRDLDNPELPYSIGHTLNYNRPMKVS